MLHVTCILVCLYPAYVTCSLYTCKYMLHVTCILVYLYVCLYTGILVCWSLIVQGYVLGYKVMTLYPSPNLATLNGNRSAVSMLGTINLLDKAGRRQSVFTSQSSSITLLI